jgi:hypothetical protein
MNRKTTLSLAVAAGLIGGIAILALALGTGIVAARTSAASDVPTTMTYQGYLTDALGVPISGTATLAFELHTDPTGGSPLWTETHSAVEVTSGFFTVLLGSITPLDATAFQGTTRYLQVSVDTGGGFEDLPRQPLASVPYAFQAQEAVLASTAITATYAVQAGEAAQASTALTATLALSATQAPWSGLTGVPAGFADNVDDAGGAYENVIVVAKSGGDYTSVADALDSTSDASADNRYLVWVAPGVYTETNLSQVRAYVHLQGAGPNATLVTSLRTNTSQTPDAATVQLDDLGRVSDLSVANAGTGTYGIGIHSTSATRDSLIDNAVVEARGSSGTAHYALYLNDSEPTIRNSWLQARDASVVNAALGSVNAAGGFPQALILDSTLIGGAGDGKTCADNTGTGFGLQMTNSAPDVRNSYICGGHRGIYSGIAGIPRVRHSHVEVSGTSGAFLFETTGSSTITVANSGVFYIGNKHTGVGGLTCVHSYKANYTAATDGTTSGTACN